VSSNVDAPEGILEALMQVGTCKNQLGWRFQDNTRRLVVISTDGPFHLAGDGKVN